MEELPPSTKKMQGIYKVRPAQQPHDVPSGKRLQNTTRTMRAVAAAIVGGFLHVDEARALRGIWALGIKGASADHPDNMIEEI